MADVTDVWQAESNTSSPLPVHAEKPFRCDAEACRRRDRLEHAFAPVVSNRLRLVVTATNGSNVKLDEIEVYAE